MTTLLLLGWGCFAWSSWRRWRLLTIGAAEPCFDQIGRRLMLTLKFAIGQARMPRYRWSGIAHILVFAGFGVLLLRTLILWSRGYAPNFNFWVFGPTQPLGVFYALLKDTFVLLVILGVVIFFYYRNVKKLPRLTLNREGLVILGIIFTMMISDLFYDAAHMALRNEFHAAEYAGFVLGKAIYGWPYPLLVVLEQGGFWTHVFLVLIFLNVLPYSKHFHIITAIPNVFFADLTPRGRLKPIADIEGKIEREETLGISRIENLGWKGILDLYTCTECGRCSDVCPAANTGKLLSPKHLTINLRDHLYSRQNEVFQLSPQSSVLSPVPLVADSLIKPEVLWACTTCRACEEECPVFITYVDKIVDMRRNLVMEKSEFPETLQNAFRGLESSGNPWSYPADDRLKWTEGLEIPLIADKPDAEYLFWVGCAGTFDARARNVTIATAKLLQTAGVSFAILGLEETCTGDPARRAGNEFLFQMLAQQNCETLNRYNIKKIIASCPHCFNTIRNEYPDFGGKFEVLHHSDILARLIRDGKLKPKKAVVSTITYHDSCYLGRYNDVYDPPREILQSIPGVQLVEPEKSRDRGMCCGAGGAQFFKEEEQGAKRVNQERVEQLLSVFNSSAEKYSAVGSTSVESTPTDATNHESRITSHGSQATTCAVSSACPFCMRMLTDGLAGQHCENVQQLDVAEVLSKSVSDS